MKGTTTITKSEVVSIYDGGILKTKYVLETYSNGQVYKIELYPKVNRDRKEVTNDGLL